MGGKTDYQAMSTTQGGVGFVVADPAVPDVSGISGPTEPVWPTTLYATVDDGSSTITTYHSDPTIGDGPMPAVSNFTPAPTGTIGIGGGGVLYNPESVDGSTILGLRWTAIYARRVVGHIIGVLNPAVFQHDLAVYPHHYFQYGKLKWVTGQNTGFECDIRESMGPVTQDGATSRPYIYGLEVMPFPLAVGDTFEALVGCNKTRFQCQLFNNMDNYRGFPDMPTEERALQTPNVMNQGYTPPKNSK